MKVLVVFAFLFAAAQADTDIMKKAAEVVPQCVTEKGLDLEKITGILEKTTLPLDNDEFTSFFTCYYHKLGFLSDSGEIDEDKLEAGFKSMIKHKFGADIDAEKLATDALEHCPDATKADIVAAIKMRNCALKYVGEHHHDYHH